MNEELTKELIDIIKSSKQFVLDQAPDVAREMIDYEIWRNKIIIKVCIQLLIAFIVLPFFVTDKDIFLALLIIEGFTGALLLVSAVDAFVELKQIEMAPRVFLLKKLRDNK